MRDSVYTATGRTGTTSLLQGKICHTNRRAAPRRTAPVRAQKEYTRVYNEKPGIYIRNQRGMKYRNPLVINRLKTKHNQTYYRKYCHVIQYVINNWNNMTRSSSSVLPSAGGGERRRTGWFRFENVKLKSPCAIWTISRATKPPSLPERTLVAQ